MILQVEGLTLYFDTALVLDGVDLDVSEGDAVGLIGPNGGGKSTLFRALAGLINYQRELARGMRREIANITYEGKITFGGERIERLLPHEVTKRRLILCPERGKLFREMTVGENLRAGAYLSKDKKEIEGNRERVYLLFPVLKDREKQRAGTLSGGERAMLAVGRSLMYSPVLLCLDEPSCGLSPLIKKMLLKRIKEIGESGTTILLAEQDANFAFRLTRESYVFSRGRTVAKGTRESLMGDETISRTYFGL